MTPMSMQGIFIGNHTAPKIRTTTCRPNTTLESLAKLPTVFKKNGVVTAGSASGICDGAAAVVIASEAAVKRLELFESSIE